MSESDILEAPKLNLRPKPRGDEKWRREKEAFLRVLPDLLKTYRDKFVAIHDGAVVAVGDTRIDAAMKAYERVGYIPLHVGLVTDHPLPKVRILSPRVARRAASI